MNKYLSLCIVALIFNSTAHAAQFGVGSKLDRRIQTVTFNPDDVFNVRVKTGTVSVVQVGKNETIQDVGLGDPLAWKVSVRNNSVFFRPVAEDNPATNVTIVTNKNIYPLYLVSVASNPTYVLRFDYPASKSPTTMVYPCSAGGIMNGHYQLQGDKSIYPYQVWDDGEFTCFRWKGRQEMPVVYRENADGKENLVNFHMQKNTMVVHEVADKFVLRLGDQVLNVRTASIVEKKWNERTKEKYSYEQ